VSPTDTFISFIALCGWFIDHGVDTLASLAIISSEIYSFGDHTGAFKFNLVNVNFFEAGTFTYEILDTLSFS
jgi:hypothetical protein